MILNMSSVVNFFARDLTLKVAQAGTFTDFDWVPGTYVDTPIKGDIQPLTAHELDILPEGERDKEIVKLYTTVRVYITGERFNTESDLIDDRGKIYKAIEVYDRFIDARCYKVILEFLPKGLA